MVGLTVLCGLEGQRSFPGDRSRQASASEQTTAGVLWLYVLSFAPCDLRLGYLLLHREAPGLARLLLI